MKFTRKNSTHRGWDGIDLWAYNDAPDFANANAVYFEVTGSHGKVKSTKCDRVYLVLEGKGEFEVDGKKEIVEPTDVIIVPKNTPYDYRAIEGSTLKLYLVHTPAFDPESEVKLD